MITDVQIERVLPAMMMLICFVIATAGGLAWLLMAIRPMMQRAKLHTERDPNRAPAVGQSRSGWKGRRQKW